MQFRAWGFKCRSATGAGLFLLVQATQANAQAVCLDHDGPGDPVNLAPCVVPDGTTLTRVESRGDGSTIGIEGDVTGGVVTFDPNSGVTNNGGGGFFIATLGDNSDIINTSNTFPFRFPDLRAFGAGSDIFNSGSAALLENRGAGGTIINSGSAATAQLGAQDGLFRNTGSISSITNISGQNSRFENEGDANFIVFTGEDITFVNSGTTAALEAIPLANNLRIENTNLISGDVDLDGDLTAVENAGTIDGSVTSIGDDFELINSGTITGSVDTSGENTRIVNSDSIGSFTIARGANARLTNSGTATQFNSFGDNSIVENSGTVTSIVTRGVNSTVNNEGLVTDFITTFDENGIVTNSGMVNQGIQTSAENADVINSGSVDLNILTFGQNADVTNTGSVSDTVFSFGDNAVVDNSGTVGANILTTGDNTQIVNSGQVSGQIDVRGENTRINNSGAADSILVSSAATGSSVDNSGTVANDIFVEASGVTVDNSGTVGGAIEMTADNATITNSGNATALVADGAGSEIVNSGIVTELVRADGNGARFINSGRAGSFVGAGENTSIDNSGRIDLIGTSGDNVRVVNSGRIGGGNSGDGIEFLGANARLELRRGSVIEGQISFQGGGTQTLEIGDLGEVNYTFDGAPNRVVTNGAPYVLSGNRLSIINTTALSTQDEQLANLTGGISSVLAGRFQALRSPAPDAVTRNRAAFPFAEPQADHSVWLDTFGSYRNQDADGQVAENTQWVGGVLAGVDAVDINGLETGFFIGGSRGGVDADDVSQSVDNKSYFLGSYASTRWGGTLIDMALTLGYSEFDQERQAANNTVSGGCETISADFDGWFVSPAVTFTRPTQIAGRQFESSLGLRYAGLFLDSYTETGTTSPQTIDSRTVHVGVARLQIAAPHQRVTASGSLLKYRVQGGLEARTNFGGDSVDGVLLGQDIRFDTGGDDNVLGGFVNLSGEYQTRNGLIVSAGTEAIYETSGSYQLSARAGLEFRF